MFDFARGEWSRVCAASWSLVSCTVVHGVRGVCSLADFIMVAYIDKDAMEEMAESESDRTDTDAADHGAGSETTRDPDAIDAGHTYTLAWRVMMWGNSAVQPYYTMDIDVFAKHDKETDETLLFVHPDWLADADPADREYALATADAVPPAAVADHIENIVHRGETL